MFGRMPIILFLMESILFMKNPISHYQGSPPHSGNMICVQTYCRQSTFLSATSSLVWYRVLSVEDKSIREFRGKSRCFEELSYIFTPRQWKTKLRKRRVWRLHWPSCSSGLPPRNNIEDIRNQKYKLDPNQTNI
uniref:Uncharacterized protein n=1 Tax=Fundulus heteroclitus TaxID=8078 RepID=A0A3Q2PDQ8_FUNHE